jgi:hypothetical protein
MTIELLTMIVVFKPAGTDHGAFEYVLGVADVPYARSTSWCS